MNHQEPNDFRDLKIPSPPPELRQRTLRAAQAVLDQPAVDSWTRIWENTQLRLLWAACAMVLVAGHLLITPPPQQGTSVAQFVVNDNEISEIIDLPRIDTTAQSPSAALAFSAPDTSKETSL